MDIYRPTLKSLSLIYKNYTHRGSILAFDEFNCDIYKGESQAYKDWIKKTNKNFKIYTNQFSSRGSYIVAD